MKKIILICSLIITTTIVSFSQTIATDTCVSGGGGGGNLVIFANYDGGVLNINVDQNIPNLKIGVCTYEPVTINLSGPFVANVTEVRYAGYVSTTNFHCFNSPSTTTITGAPGGATTSVNFLPPSTLSNPNGYSSIVCAYSCNTSTNQGGCNTADQIVDYFETSTGGNLHSYYTQYGCWSTTPYNVSAGGNCPFTGPADTTIITFTTSASTICAGTAVNFNDFSPSATSWTWSAPSSTNTSGTNSFLNTTWTTPGSYTVTLTVDDGSGTCSANQIVTVLAQPSIVVTATPNPVCEGDSVHLQMTGGVAYLWENGSFNPSIYITPNSSLWFEGGGMGSNSCTNTDSIFIVVHPEPVDPFLIYVAGVLQVTPTGFIYNWYLDGNQIVGATGSSYTPTVNGIYTVEYVDSNGCTSNQTGIPVNDQNSSIEELNSTVQISPNPSSGIFQINMANTMGEMTIEIFDVLGKTVYTNKVYFNNTYTIDISETTKGTYMIKTTINNQERFGKLVIR